MSGRDTVRLEADDGEIRGPSLKILYVAAAAILEGTTLTPYLADRIRGRWGLHNAARHRRFQSELSDWNLGF